jgi:hypothetical protein
MSIRVDHVEAIERFGYTRTEARFLYLVATHSGYFTQQQFLRFAGVNPGGMGTRLTVKALEQGHIRTAKLARHTQIYNLFARPFYREIDKGNLRNRRRLSDELIRTRLLILDFVLAHCDLDYLETEHEKVRYFHEERRLPLTLLPHRTYKGTRSQGETDRYFVDRFSIFLGHPEPASGHSSPAFVYCDSASNSLLGFVSYLESYQPLLRRLSAFEIVYAAPKAGKFRRAEAFFTRLFAPTTRVNTQHLWQYFTVRQLWERGQTSQLTRADRELLRDGDHRYQGQTFDHMYREWQASGLSPTQLNTLVNPDSGQPKMAFKTHLLPESYDILDHVSIRKNRRGSGTVRGNAHSTNDSAASSTSGTRKYLKAQEQTHEQHL